MGPTSTSSQSSWSSSVRSGWFGSVSQDKPEAVGAAYDDHSPPLTPVYKGTILDTKNTAYDDHSPPLILITRLVEPWWIVWMVQFEQKKKLLTAGFMLSSEVHIIAIVTNRQGKVHIIAIVTYRQTYTPPSNLPTFQCPPRIRKVSRNRRSKKTLLLNQKQITDLSIAFSSS